nr:AAA family ATPase [Candidatus Sigynarchaeota archaeon]
MLVTVAGLHGTGKTTVAEIIAVRLCLRHISTGMLFREMASEQGMDLVEFSTYAEQHDEIDQDLDARMTSIGKDGNVVLDGQLCWFFLKDHAQYKILLKCDDGVRIGRIYQREREKKGDLVTLESVTQETLHREKSERERYKRIYGIDLGEEAFVERSHDLVIDTTCLSIEAVVQHVLDFIQ